MALSNEDKADVKNAMGKAIANKVSKVTKDSGRTYAGYSRMAGAYKVNEGKTTHYFAGKKGAMEFMKSGKILRNQ